MLKKSPMKYNPKQSNSNDLNDDFASEYTNNAASNVSFLSSVKPRFTLDYDSEEEIGKPAVLKDAKLRKASSSKSSSSDSDSSSDSEEEIEKLSYFAQAKTAVSSFASAVWNATKAAPAAAWNATKAAPAAAWKATKATSAAALNTTKAVLANRHVRMAIVAGVVTAVLLNVGAVAGVLTAVSALGARVAATKAGVMASTFLAGTRAQAGFNFVASFIPRALAVFAGVFAATEAAVVAKNATVSTASFVGTKVKETFTKKGCCGNGQKVDIKDESTDESKFDVKKEPSVEEKPSLPSKLRI